MDFNAECIPFSLEATAKLAVQGRLDSNSARDFAKQVEDILAGPVEILILDLSKLVYISSAGLRVLMTANNRLAEREGRVILTNLQPQIAKVIEMIRKLPGLHVFADDAELDRYLNDIQEKVLREKERKKG